MQTGNGSVRRHLSVMEAAQYGGPLCRRPWLCSVDPPASAFRGGYGADRATQAASSRITCPVKSLRGALQWAKWRTAGRSEFTSPDHLPSRMTASPAGDSEGVRFGRQMEGNVRKARRASGLRNQDHFRRG